MEYLPICKIAMFGKDEIKAEPNIQKDAYYRYLFIIVLDVVLGVYINA